MNKKTNTLLFVLGATVFNIIITIVSMALLTLFYAKFIIHLLPEAVQIWGFPLMFIAAIVISFIVYRCLLKLLMKKFRLEDYLDPIFRNRK